MTKLAADPTPGNYYRIKKGDTLLGIAGRAYKVKAGTKERLAFARTINRDPLNQKYLRKDKTTKLFPEGLLSFFPRFSCDKDTLIESGGKPPKGSCYAIIWIPLVRYNYHPILGQGNSIAVESEAFDFEEELAFESERRKRRNPYRRVNTKAVPFRWICHLKANFPDPDDDGREIEFESGTGTLISPRHVLTAAHVLYHEINGSKGTPAWKKARSVKVVPGRNGVLSAPFGVARAPSRDFVHHPSYELDGSTFEQYDYGMIKLTTGNSKFQKLRNSIGYWGQNSQFKFEPTSSFDLDNKLLRTSGYPLFRLYHQRRTAGKVTNNLASSVLGDGPFPDLIVHMIPSLPGQSGSPMWLESIKGKKRFFHFVAVNQSGNYNFPGSNPDPRLVKLKHFVSGLGTVVTDELVRTVNQWKARM